MSVSGISSTNYFAQQQAIQNNQQQFLQEFQQLGKDLTAGNLSAAQSDFATLQQVGPESNNSQVNNPIAQAFNQLGQDLQAGNTAAAHQDYANLQQDFQNAPRQATGHHRHPHSETEGPGGSQNADTQIANLFQQLGQDLQSNNLAGAQQAYSSLLQDFQSSSGGGFTPQAATSTAVSLSA
jgi:hypothetical protein